MSKSKIARAISAAFLTAGLSVIPAWTALAVTNPADNPAPITVTGDDGNIYHDGADTLPGYDDEECTYIPGAYFDFAANRVRYADGQSIVWTEWDRASGYREWLAARNVTSPSTSTNTGSSSAGTTNTKSAATKGSSKTNAITSASEVTEGTATEVATGTEKQSNTVAVSFVGDNAQNPGRSVGLAILGFLFGSGILTYLGSVLRTRLAPKRNIA